MFKVQDLMIEVLAAGGGGGAMMPAPTEPTPPSPISPVAAVAAFTPRFEAIDRVAQMSEKVDVTFLDKAALEIGRALVAVRVAAYCSQEMATCDANPQISPWASAGVGELRTADFGILQDHVHQTVKWIDEQGDLLEKRAVEQKAELLPRLETAAEYLRSGATRPQPRA